MLELLPIHSSKMQIDRLVSRPVVMSTTPLHHYLHVPLHVHSIDFIDFSKRRQFNLELEAQK